MHSTPLQSGIIALVLLCAIVIWCSYSIYFIFTKKEKEFDK